MFDNLGFQEIALIAVLFIVFFGPKKIPEVMNGIGRGVREFKKAMSEVQGELSNISRMPPDDAAVPKPGPTPPENQSSTTA